MKKSLLSLAALAARLMPARWKQALYRSGPLARLIRGALNRAAPTGLAETVVAGGDLAGCRLLLDLQTEKDFWLGTYEPDLQAAIRELVPRGAVAYDVGANIGYITLLLARAAGEGGRAHAFEALPDNVERLRRNMELNGLAARVTIVPAAVAGAQGTVTFLVHASGGMGKAAGSAGRDEAYQKKIEVPGLCLDDYVYKQGNPAPAVLKMDIEGGEVLALPGMRRLLREAHPLLFLELHGPESARAAWEELTAAGYVLTTMDPGRPRVNSLEELGWKAYLIAR